MAAIVRVFKTRGAADRMVAEFATDRLEGGFLPLRVEAVEDGFAVMDDDVDAPANLPFLVNLDGLDSDGRWYGLAACSTTEYATAMLRAEIEDGIFSAFRWTAQTPGAPVLDADAARALGLPDIATLEAEYDGGR